MSSERTDSTGMGGSNRSEDNDDRLEAVIESLNSKITAFEQNLESAVLAESQFQGNIQTLLNSLDAFVERHVEKDRHLTQLIEEDTQRSKEAKEEYDALASRFDHTLRRDNLTRTREWLRTVSVYIGIVISVVLMAPLHALWWIITRTLARVGILKSSDETTIYSTEQARERDVTHKAASSNRPATATRHRRRASATGPAVVNEHESPIASSSAPKQKEEVIEQTNVPDAPSSTHGNNGGQTHRNIPAPVGSFNADADFDDGFHSVTREAGPQSRRGEASQSAESSGSDEEFFDARNGSEQPSPDLKETPAAQIEEIQHEEKHDEDNINRESTRLRPGWAIPAGSDETLPDLSAFPSSDFWEISDDDIRLEVQRSDQASN